VARIGIVENMNDETLKTQIRLARGKFAAMAGTYALGVFNDNFFKEAAMLLAVAAQRTELQGYATVLFALPYIVFAAPAGWLADRFSKGRVVVFAKVLELAAMICGAVGIVIGSWPMVLAMVFTMGLQSAIFSPALNGSIPELYPPSYVTTANARLKVVVTATILAGVAMAGPVLDLEGDAHHGVEFGRWAVAAAVLAVAVLGVLGSLAVPMFPPSGSRAKFPWTGPGHTVPELRRIWKDPLLTTIIGADVFIWFVGSLQILLINQMGMEQFDFGETRTSLLVAAELLGIAAGGLLASRLAKGPRWYRVLPSSALTLGVMTALVSLVPLLPSSMRLGALAVVLGATGTAGGLFMIPCESFIQVRPAADRKGAVIAAANFTIFSGILLTGLVANLLNKHILPTHSFLVISAMALGVACWLGRALRKEDDRS